MRVVIESEIIFTNDIVYFEMVQKNVHPSTSVCVVQVFENLSSEWDFCVHPVNIE
jgi:hypothetical protein